MLLSSRGFVTPHKDNEKPRLLHEPKSARPQNILLERAEVYSVRNARF